jgi:hypothetical protein
MLSFSSLARIRRHWKKQRAHREYRGSLLFPDSRLVLFWILEFGFWNWVANPKSAIANPESGDPPVDSDISYEDALLDSQIRQCMAAEYSNVEPPPGVFARVVQAIHEDVEPNAKWRMRAAEFIRYASPATWVPAIPQSFGALVSALYRPLTGPAMARLVPGVVALTLVMAVMGAGTSHLVRGVAPEAQLYSDLAEPPTAVEVPVGLSPLNLAIANGEDPYAARLTSSQDAEPYDLAELHIPAKVRNSQPATVETADSTPYDRTKPR